MSEELKACPFCGGKPFRYVEYGPFNTIRAVIECHLCEAQASMPGRKDKPLSAEEAVTQRWNKRWPNV